MATNKNALGISLIDLLFCSAVIAVLVVGCARYSDWRLSIAGPADWPDVHISTYPTANLIVVEDKTAPFHMVVRPISIRAAEYSSAHKLAQAIRRAALLTQRRLDVAHAQEGMSLEAMALIMHSDTRIE